MTEGGAIPPLATNQHEITMFVSILHNEKTTCEISKEVNKYGSCYEVKTYPRNSNPKNTFLKTEFYVFATAYDLVEFVAFNDFK